MLKTIEVSSTWKEWQMFFFLSGRPNKMLHYLNFIKNMFENNIAIFLGLVIYEYFSQFFLLI